MAKSVTEEYLEYHDIYVKKFGERRTLVLMQVGSFYEAYAIPNRGPDLKILEELTDASIAHKGKNKKVVDIQNPLMWGFPMVAGSKFIGLLIDAGYRLIMVDQVTPKPNIRRQVTAIHSPATYLEQTHRTSSNYVAAIYVEELIQKNGCLVICVGMSAVDVSTGEVLIHESHSAANDEKISLDETVRFLNSLVPKEIIIFTENAVQLTEEYLKEYFELDGKYFQFKKPIKEHQKTVYQKKLLEKIYMPEQTESNQSTSIQSVIDRIGISQTIYAKNALVLLFVHVSDHHMDLLRGIRHPTFYFDNRQLILGNDAINQLNVTSESGQKTGDAKYRCLMDCINRASTAMGKRYIKMKLTSPYTDPQILGATYDAVNAAQQSHATQQPIYEKITHILRSVHDIERLYRKLSIGVLHPMHIVDFTDSLRHISELFLFVKDGPLSAYIRTKDLRKKIIKLNELLERTIDREKAKLFTVTGIRENIFNQGIYPDIDVLQSQIGANEGMIEELMERLTELMDDGPNKIILKNNTRDGYYYQMTAKRYRVLAKKFAEQKQIKLSGKTIDVSDFQISENKNTIKLSLPFLKNNLSADIDQLTDRIKIITYKHYVDFMTHIKTKYGQIIERTIHTITQCDYYSTIARVAAEYNYRRPIINDTQNGRPYVDAKDLRHPIVERIIDHEYIPQTISVGTDEGIRGMLLYGLNSAGKSVLMKAIGLSVIMAQAGFFVPASQFTFYPYKSLYTRITGTDNLFRGLSSYSVEIIELNNILKRADSYSLVIGDEICRGTEHISGNAIVAASLLKLSAVRSTFVFATHLHELMDLDEIKEKKDIRSFHISVRHDTVTDRLIYDRQLTPGPGDRLYGITFAKYIIRDTDFINKALEIKNILTNNDPDSSVVSVRRSRYNSKLIMDCCAMCGKKNNFKGPSLLETHHIEHQKNAINGFIENKQHIKKNHISNLRVLCGACHDLTHDRDRTYDRQCLE